MRWGVRTLRDTARNIRERGHTGPYSPRALLMHGMDAIGQNKGVHDINVADIVPFGTWEENIVVKAVAPWPDFL